MINTRYNAFNSCTRLSLSNIINISNDNFNNINKIIIEDYKNMKEKDDNIYNKKYNADMNKELNNIYLKEVR